jgi:hypothetical protein
VEHRAILGRLAEIEALPPGLYEMKIDSAPGEPACEGEDRPVRFEPRRLEDMRAAPSHAASERAAEVSAFNEALYRTIWSPWVQAATTPWSAEALRWLHPMRLRRHAFAGAFNPWMRAVAAAAEGVRSRRAPLPDDHPMMEMEGAALRAVGTAIETARVGRDAWLALAFTAIYGPRKTEEARDERD